MGSLTASENTTAALPFPPRLADFHTRGEGFESWFRAKGNKGGVSGVFTCNSHPSHMGKTSLQRAADFASFNYLIAPGVRIPGLAPGALIVISNAVDELLADHPKMTAELLWGLRQARRVGEAMSTSQTQKVLSGQLGAGVSDAVIMVLGSRTTAAAVMHQYVVAALDGCVLTPGVLQDMNCTSHPGNAVVSLGYHGDMSTTIHHLTIVAEARVQKKMHHFNTRLHPKCIGRWPVLP